ncbi:MAG: hypothetical protein ABR540_19020 [Acidimicrobiales bacterium]
MKFVAVLAAVALVHWSGAAIAASTSGNPKTPGTGYVLEDAVLMKCMPGQVDINHAPVGELVTRLLLDVAVAERLISQRPYLQPSDLTVVNGIGPGTRNRILSAGSACATLTSEPPPAGAVCADPLLVDLQLASAGDLEKRLGLSSPGAAAVVAGRPYAQQAHVTPERVPGLGKGNYDRLKARSCLTPATVETGTKRFQWVYSSSAATVRRGGYSLAVPAGVIDGVGSWVSIEGLATSPVPLEGPAANFHIWSPWANGTDTVTVGLPVNDQLTSLLALGLVRTVAHVPADPSDLKALELSVPSNTVVEGGTIFAATTELSSFVSTVIDSAFFVISPVIGPVLRYVSFGDFVEAQMQSYLGLRASMPRCPNGPPPRTFTAGSAIATDPALERPPLLYCVDTAANGDALWRLMNNSGSVLSVYTGLTGVTIADIGGGSGRPGGTDEFLVDSTYDLWNNTTSHDEATQSRVSGEVPPGAELVLRGPVGTVQASVPVEVSTTFTVGTLALRSVGALLPDELKLLFSSTKCGVNAFNILTEPKALAGCAVDIADALLKWFVGVVLAVADAVLSLEATIRGELSGPWSLELSHLAPPPPPSANQPGGGGSPSPGGSPAPDGSMIIKVGWDAWLLDVNGVAHRIQDGGAYECLADRYPVRYDLSPAEFSLFAPGGVGGVANCPFNIPEVVIAPDTADREYGIHGTMLRQSDGTTWLIDQNGYRSPVASGSFNCFADLYLVWDLVEWEEVQRFTRDPSIVTRFCTLG